MPNIASPARTDCSWPLLATAAGCLLALAVALSAVVAVPWPLSESGLASTQIAHYNRWGWALLTTLLLFGLPAGAGERGARHPLAWAAAESAAIATLLSLLFFLKATYSSGSCCRLQKEGRISKFRVALSDFCGKIRHQCPFSREITMLLRFGVANFRSIRDYQEILLTASTRIKRAGLSIPVPVLRQSAVPVAAIYGTNASGKSNLVAAINAMRQHIVKSHKSRDATDPIPKEHFRLDRTSASQPTRFDCMFALNNSETDAPGQVYEYGFEFSTSEYTKEWLRCTVRRERLTTRTLFKRETIDGEVRMVFGNQLRGENRATANLTRPNSLFLSAAAQNNHSQLSGLHKVFVKGWSMLLERRIMTNFLVAEQLDNYPHMRQLMDVIRQADLGIVGTDPREHDMTEKQRDIFKKAAELISSIDQKLKVEDMEEEDIKVKEFRFTHSGLDNEIHSFDYDLESQGTWALTSMLIPALDSLSSGSLLVVDEVEASLHPRLTQAIISLFKGLSNRHGAQLICSTHDASLLQEGALELDEVWMAEKGKEGISSFNPLTDYRLRSRDDIERAYRQGRVGGVPSRRDFLLDFNP